MRDAPETITVDTADVVCDGGGGGSGHPTVFLTMGNNSHVDCPYCGRRYRLAEGRKASPAGH